MLSKNGRQKIIKDVNKEATLKLIPDDTFENSNNGRRIAYYAQN